MTLPPLSSLLLYADDSLVVVEKPAGILSVPGRYCQHSIAKSVVDFFAPYCIAQPAVHRLDMDTSGLLVLARTAHSHRHLSIQFSQRKVFKRYDALVDGKICADKGSIKLAFRLNLHQRPLQCHDPLLGKMGITYWEKRADYGELTHLAFYPHTGRTHQLRLHAAHPKGLGAPILGDPFYSKELPWKKPSDFGSHIPRDIPLHLHASLLAFEHPLTQQALCFKSPIPWQMPLGEASKR